MGLGWFGLGWVGSGFEDMMIKKDDEVFYQIRNKKAWLGPGKVVDIDKNGV